MTRYSILGATAEQVRAIGGREIKEAHSSGVIFATLTPEQVTKLKELNCQVNPLGKTRPAVMPPAPVAAAPVYSPEQLVIAAGYEDLRNMTIPPLYGQGINVAVLDSGIRESHEGVNNRVIYSKNYTLSPMGDGFNHGTGVVSVILAVAPLCGILNMKVLDNRGMGTEEEVVLAIDDCINLRDTQPSIAPSVINVSLGSPDDGNPNNIMRVACRAAIENGVWVICAAGNDGPEPQSVICPACERYVLAAGSAKYEPFTVSEFSSRGPTREGLIKPDGVLFGEDIVVASSVSDTAALAKSGTSFSAPFAAGLIALYHEGTLIHGGVRYPGEVPPGIFPELTELVSVEKLQDTYLAGVCVKPQGVATGKDNSYGYGLPFGPLIAQIIGVRPALNIESLMTGVVAIGMMGAMIKTLGGK